nr:MAG: hypothetical protein [Bacteriophage sp.]
MGIVLGYIKREYSDGSSLVTTTPFIVSFSGILVRENRYAILLIINKTLYKYGK